MLAGGFQDRLDGTWRRQAYNDRYLRMTVTCGAGAGIIAHKDGVDA
jgi:hypothetical protein